MGDPPLMSDNPIWQEIIDAAPATAEERIADGEDPGGEEGGAA